MWTGQRYDPGVELYAFVYRAYSPQLGRWLQRDPLGYVDGMNLYEYVAGGPVTAIDPLGLSYLIVGIDQPGEGGDNDKFEPQPGPGKGVDPGHAFVLVSPTPNPADADVGGGLYPAFEIDPIRGPYEGPGEVRDDSVRPPADVYAVYDISDEQADQVTERIENDRQNPPDYDLGDNNCADYVCDIAEFLGIELPDNGNITNPGQLGEDLVDNGQGHRPGEEAPVTPAPGGEGSDGDDDPCKKQDETPPGDKGQSPPKAQEPKASGK
jgi:RHS repeat-associated protein